MIRRIKFLSDLYSSKTSDSKKPELKLIKPWVESKIFLCKTQNFLRLKIQIQSSANTVEEELAENPIKQSQ